MKRPAYLGGPRAFDRPRHVGQINLPEWSKFEAACRALFERRYFANHGPLEAELERRLAALFGVKHAVSVVNGTVALMVAARALELRDQVILPAFTFAATAEALAWAGLEPVFCDVAPASHCLSAEIVEPLVTDRTSAILGVHLWGRACDPERLADLARQRNIRLFFDAAHAVGCTFNARPIGGLGDAEVFSFHATKVLNGVEGGCITTNDDALADRLRACRTFHDGVSARVPVRLNAKISEAQAMMALLSLDDLPSNIEANRRRYALYQAELDGLSGIRFVDHAAGEASNWQYVIIEVVAAETTLTRDTIIAAMHAENVQVRDYFSPPLHRMKIYTSEDGSAPSLPVTECLAANLFQLPTGQSIDDDDVISVCRTLRAILAHADEIIRR